MIYNSFLILISVVSYAVCVKIQQITEPMYQGEGPHWDARQQALYFVSNGEVARIHKYVLATGVHTKTKVANLKYIFNLKKNNIKGIPDGTIIDTDGNLWVACFEDSSVIKIDPRTGKLLQKVPIPSFQVTSVTFGGPNFDILFVTTANLNSFAPPDGATFMVTGMGVKGLPNRNFKL